MEYNSSNNQLSLLFLNDKKLFRLLVLMVTIASFGVGVNYFKEVMMNSNEAKGIESASSRLLSTMNMVSGSQRMLESDVYGLFLKDLSGKVFEGTYGLSGDFGLFEEKSGKIRIYFYYLNYQSYSVFTIDYTLLNGNYKEKWLSIVQEFTINQFFNSSEVNVVMADNKIKLSSLKTKKAKVITKNLFKAVNKTNSLVDTFNLDVSIPYFYNMTGNLALPNLSIAFEYTVNMKQNDSANFERKLDNLGFILTTLAFINLYYTIVTIRDCLTQNINPKSFSPYLIIGDMIWNADLALCCLYLAMTQKSKFVDFSVSSFIFCVNFSIFEMRLLYLSYKSQDEFNHPQFQDEELQKKKILRFYSILYGVILVSLLYLYYIILHSALLFIVIFLTFIPQIYHNAKVSILKNKIPSKAILMFSVNKLFIPLYIRLWPFNIIEAKPDYFFSIASIAFIMLEVFLMFLQGKFGGMFMIPKKFRKGYYNYFKPLNEIATLTIDFDKSTCAICLDLFDKKPQKKAVNGAVSKNDNDLSYAITVPNATNAGEIALNLTSNQTEINRDLDIANKKEIKEKRILGCCYRIKALKQTTLMITPCNHCFHSECLKEWCTYKNECPICRKILPSIE